MNGLVALMALALQDPYAIDDPIKPLVQAAYRCALPAYASTAADQQNAFEKIKYQAISSLEQIEDRYQFEGLSSNLNALLTDQPHTRQLGDGVIAQLQRASQQKNVTYSPDLYTPICNALMLNAINTIELETAYSQQRLPLLKTLQPIKQRPLKYAKQIAQTSTVTGYEASVDSNGQVTSCMPIGDDATLNNIKQITRWHRANCKAIRQFKYQPAMVNGTAVGFTTQIQLDDEGRVLSLASPLDGLI